MEGQRVRFGQVGRLRQEKTAEYESLHRDAWPKVLEMIKSCNLENYSIYRHEDLVFSYFEYTGDDFQKDMEKMEQDEATKEWWKHTKPCFINNGISAKSEFYHDMKQIFYLQ